MYINIQWKTKKTYRFNSDTSNQPTNFHVSIIRYFNTETIYYCILINLSELISLHNNNKRQKTWLIFISIYKIYFGWYNIITNTDKKFKNMYIYSTIESYLYKSNFHICFRMIFNIVLMNDWILEVQCNMIYLLIFLYHTYIITGIKKSLLLWCKTSFKLHITTRLL